VLLGTGKLTGGATAEGGVTMSGADAVTKVEL